MTPIKELEELTNLLEIPLVAGVFDILLNILFCLLGTVNRGSDMIGSGLVGNDWCAVCGLATTATELSIIERIFRLNEVGIGSTSLMDKFNV
jgi:translation initiation factor 6